LSSNLDLARISMMGISQLMGTFSKKKLSLHPYRRYLVAFKSELNGSNVREFK